MVFGVAAVFRLVMPGVGAFRCLAPVDTEEVVVVVVTDVKDGYDVLALVTEGRIGWRWW